MNFNRQDGSSDLDRSWPVFTVAALQAEGALLVEDGNHGENRPRPDEFAENGMSFIRAADMDDGQVLFGRAARINDTALRRIRKGIGKPGDVLLSHKGTVGKVAFAPLNSEPFVCSPQTTFWRVTNEERIDRRYLYSYLRSNGFQQQLRSRKGETDMADYVSLTSQRTLTVPLPPLPEQRAIAAILGALDDKIELNRRMNRTLEELARAIFRSWFVDFDPVRAKAAGRAPVGMDAETAALFPAGLVESEVGLVPEGWGVGTLDDVSRVVYGQPFSSALFNATRTGVPLLRIRDLATYSPDVFTTEVHPRGRMVEPGDVVAGMDGEFRVHLWQGADAWLNQRVCLFEPKPGVSKYYLYFAASGPLAFFEATKSGTTVIHLSKRDLDSVRLVVPPTPLLEAFGAVADPIARMVVEKAKEAATLATTRDYLLPKLLSGKVRVGQALPEGYSS